MTGRLLKHALAAALVFATADALAQTAPAEIVDSQKPPAGFVAPKASEARDLSMAKYARDSFLDGEEGIVGLRVLVRTNGAVGETQIAQSSGSPRLDKYAQDLVKDWRYQPATLNGAQVDAWIPINIVWALQTLRFNLAPDAVKKMGTFYPRASVSANEVGTSTVHFLVGTDGRVTKVLVDRSSGHPRLDDATVTMLKSGLKVTPEVQSTGEKTAVWYRVGIYWSLNGIKTKDEDPCLVPLETANPDTVIAACARFLMRSGITPYERALALLSSGEAHLLKREFSATIADSDAGLRASPGLANLFILRGRAHLAEGNRDLAFSDFDAAIQVEPRSYEPILWRAQTNFDSGQIDKALADFQIAMRLPTTDNVALLGSRCRFLTHIGRPQDGLGDCDKGLSLDRTRDELLESRGNAYFKLGQYKQAIQDYDAAVGRNRRSASALYARGVAMLKAGDAKGEADINAAKAINPYIADAMAEAGVTP